MYLYGSYPDAFTNKQIISVQSNTTKTYFSQLNYLHLRAGMDGCEQSRSHRDSILGPSSQQRLATPTKLTWPTQNIYVLTRTAPTDADYYVSVTSLLQSAIRQTVYIYIYIYGNINIQYTFVQSLLQWKSDKYKIFCVCVSVFLP
jgi:hypothetical protein